ncbi:thaumatin domain-containing protein [Legionella steigerwaltii]|uniref:Thaumatin domain-containing protein n=1 Tax=Legionella steigerwaltii TaxID=460 RepID=A0A378L4Y9_9GAMM|nr:hypothetical protein [Legionella steigerwaltii]KTD69920.1 thaumatin domain-containing protein [Legionella steigerwaltii]STY21767.1 thaumatin domain-containing protein [Legionella steigerwaltii]
MFFKRMLRIGMGGCLALSSLMVWAGTNPVDFMVIPGNGLPATTILGGSYSFKYVLTNNLPFDESLKQISYTINGSGGFTVNDACSNKTLTANGGQCTITVAFQPVTIGASNISFTLRYDNNVVPLPTLSTTIMQQSVPCSESTGEVAPVPLDPSTVSINAAGWVANCPFGYNLVCKSGTGAVNALCISGQPPKMGNFSQIAPEMTLIDELTSLPFPADMIPPSRIPPACTFPGPAAVGPAKFPNIPNTTVCVACNAFNC